MSSQNPEIDAKAREAEARAAVVAEANELVASFQNEPVRVELAQELIEDPDNNAAAYAVLDRVERADVGADVTHEDFEPGHLGSVKVARNAHGQAIAAIDAIAEEHRKAIGRIKGNLDLSATGRAKELSALREGVAKDLEKTVGPIERRVNTHLDAREKKLTEVFSPTIKPPPKTKTDPVADALAALRSELALSNFLAATSHLDNAQWANLALVIVTSGSDLSEGVLRAAALKLDPLLARLLLSRAKDATRERSLAALKRDPARLDAAAELAWISRLRTSLAHERRLARDAALRGEIRVKLVRTE